MNLKACLCSEAIPIIHKYQEQYIKLVVYWLPSSRDDEQTDKDVMI